MLPRSPNDYLQFSETDFIADPAFQQWILHSADDDTIFWTRFLQDHPHKEQAIEQARTFLHQLHFDQDLPDPSRAQESFRRHLKQLEQEHTASTPVIRRKLYARLLQTAAVVAGIALITAAVMLLLRHPQEKISTPYGQLKKLVLPDSSVIVLNAHSSLRYDHQWKADKTREVWLEGEAFFDVRHLNQNSRRIQPGEQFLVHTQDLDIAVLGTSFDIRQRRGKTEVVLQTGSIRILFKDSSRAPVLMVPGDMVLYDPALHSLLHTTTAAQDYTAWKEKKLVLHNPKVGEIVTYLEDTYGKKIRLQDSSLETKVIEGPIMLGNLDDVLFILSAVLNTRIVKQGDVITLAPGQ